jgi:hypothetical protein
MFRRQAHACSIDRLILLSGRSARVCAPFISVGNSTKPTTFVSGTPQFCLTPVRFFLRRDGTNAGFENQ